MRPVERVLGRLDKVRRVADGWQARCPAHDDANPSLSITEGTDGRILLKCHAGCPVESILAALQLSMADLFPTEQKERGRPRKPDVRIEGD